MTDNTCIDCISWVGRCVKGKIGKAASTIACEDFNDWKHPR